MIGVQGESAHTGVSGFAHGLVGATYGVHGASISPAGCGTVGEGALGTGVLGYSGSGPLPGALANTGVYGSADQAGGRGGVFVGSSAQIRLQPSASSTHPARGAKGDLFVDHGGRLWFCKGGAIWRQVA
jgi:hypothetical protein